MSSRLTCLIITFLFVINSSSLYTWPSRLQSGNPAKFHHPNNLSSMHELSAENDALTHALPPECASGEGLNWWSDSDFDPPSGYAPLTITGVGYGIEYLDSNFTPAPMIIDWGDGSPVSIVSPELCHSTPSEVNGVISIVNAIIWDTSSLVHTYTTPGWYSIYINSMGNGFMYFRSVEVLEPSCNWKGLKIQTYPFGKFTIYHGGNIYWDFLIQSLFNVQIQHCPEATFVVTPTGAQVIVDGAAVAANIDLRGRITSASYTARSSTGFDHAYGIDPGVTPWFELISHTKGKLEGKEFGISDDTTINYRWTLRNTGKGLVVVALVYQGAVWFIPAIMESPAAATAALKGLAEFIKKLAETINPNILPPIPVPASSYANNPYVDSDMVTKVDPKENPLRSEIIPPTWDVFSDLDTAFGVDFMKTAQVDTLTIDKLEELPGNEISFSGSNLSPNGDILVMLVPVNIPSFEINQEIKADENGSISGRIRIPSNADAGRWLIIAIDITKLQISLQNFVDNPNDVTTLEISMAASNFQLPHHIYLPSISNR